MADDENEIALLRYTGISGDEVPDPVRMKIGELINRWAFIEYQLKVIIRVSLGITRATQNPLLHARDIRNLCELVRQIGEVGDIWVPDASLREEMLNLQEAIAKGSTKRNDYAHGVFAIPKKGKHVGTFSRFLYQKLEHKLNPDWQPTNVKDIEPLIKIAKQFGVRAQNMTVLIKNLKRKRGEQLTCALWPLVARNSIDRKGRVVRIGRPAGFGVEQRACSTRSSRAC